MLETGSVVLACVPVAFASAALSNASTANAACLLQRHGYLASLELHIVDAALEARVQRQIVWQRIEVGNLVAAQIENGQHVHAADTSGRTARDVELAID